MLCINRSNQPPKWLHPSRPVIPFDQVAKQISILFALAMMFPILFMNDLLVPPVQDMLVLPFHLSRDFCPSKRCPLGFWCCLQPTLGVGCSLSCPEKQHLLCGDRSLPLDFSSIHLPSNSGSFIWINPPCSRKAPRIQGKLCLGGEVTAKGCRGDSVADHPAGCLAQTLGRGARDPTWGVCHIL